MRKPALREQDGLGIHACLQALDRSGRTRRRFRLAGLGGRFVAPIQISFRNLDGVRPVPLRDGVGGHPPRCSRPVGWGSGLDAGLVNRRNQLSLNRSFPISLRHCLELLPGYPPGLAAGDRACRSVSIRRGAAASPRISMPPRASSLHGRGAVRSAWLPRRNPEAQEPLPG